MVCSRCGRFAALAIVLSLQNVMALTYAIRFRFTEVNTSTTIAVTRMLYAQHTLDNLLQARFFPFAFYPSDTLLE